MITIQEINKWVGEIKSRLEATTPYPWYPEGKDKWGPDWVCAVDYHNDYFRISEQIQHRFGLIQIAQIVSNNADQDFIAHAPNDVDFLLKERERLLEILKGFGYEEGN